IKHDGKEDLRAANSSDRVPIRFSATDDVAVSKAAIEYRINEGKKVLSDPVKLRGEGGRQASAEHNFVLAGKVKPGDPVAYRIRVEDNRDIPEFKPGPQASFYPEDRWLLIKVVDNAKPLREQEIVAQRDDLNRRLEAIKADLSREKRQAYKVQQETRTTPDL